MIKINFCCEFKSDVILNAQTATEGNRETLEYIPGSNFLGILASLKYDPLSKENYEIFHSGKVRFGDAHIGKKLDENTYERSLKVPLAWHVKKGKKLVDNDNYVIYDIDPENMHRQIQEGIQLKQERSGYFIPSTGKLVSIRKSFQIKSKYDRINRTSEEGGMFGYVSLNKGSKWFFSIYRDTDIKEQPILEELCGLRHIGKSKSAQYGLVNIEKVGETEQILPKKYTKGQIILYAASDLCFVDKFGQPTLKPTASQLGLPFESEIMWKASQIRSKVYAPWNGKRKNRDADRICIEKGSVFVVHIPVDFTDELILKGIGCYRNEGLGEILINPSFLQAEKKTGKLLYELSEDKGKEICSVEDVYKGEQIECEQFNNWLSGTIQGDNDSTLLLRIALSFIDKYKKIFYGISHSQWGTIQKLAVTSGSKEELIHLLFEEEQGYLKHGVAYNIWQEQQREFILWATIDNNFSDLVGHGENLEDDLIPSCVEKIAALMQKQNSYE